MYYLTQEGYDLLDEGFFGDYLRGLKGIKTSQNVKGIKYPKSGTRTKSGGTGSQDERIPETPGESFRETLKKRVKQRGGVKRPSTIPGVETETAKGRKAVRRTKTAAGPEVGEKLGTLTRAVAWDAPKSAVKGAYKGGSNFVKGLTTSKGRYRQTQAGGGLHAQPDKPAPKKITKTKTYKAGEGIRSFVRGALDNRPATARRRSTRDTGEALGRGARRLFKGAVSGFSKWNKASDMTNFQSKAQNSSTVYTRIGNLLSESK